MDSMQGQRRGQLETLVDLHANDPTYQHQPTAWATRIKAPSSKTFGPHHHNVPTRGKPAALPLFGYYLFFLKLLLDARPCRHCSGLWSAHKQRTMPLSSFRKCRLMKHLALYFPSA